MTTLNATLSFKIPQLSAELPDPTSYLCPALNGLEGNDRIVVAYKLVCQQEDFCTEAEPTGAEGMDGTIHYELPVEKQVSFWTYCFEQGYTLADLDKGVRFNGATYTSAAADLGGYQTVEEAGITEAEFDRFEKLAVENPSALLVQSNGTVIIKS